MKRWENDFVEGIDCQKEKGKQLINPKYIVQDSQPYR